MDKSFELHTHSQPRLRLQTLIILRWMAVAGQLAAIIVVDFVMGFPLPIYFCLALIASSAWLNIFLSLRYPASHRLEHNAAFGLLSYDIMQLGFLLFLTGGLNNPFSIMLIVPVVVAASILPKKWIILLGALCVVLATTIAIFHQPLPWYQGEEIALPLFYIAGNWVAIISGLAFTTIYTFRVSDESRNLSDALSATELILQREQHLTALDGLAAAAAHELGTPLGTIALVSKEMVRELDETDPLHEDAKLLRSQAERCREILQKLTSLSTDGEMHIGKMPITSLIEEVVSPHRDFGIEIDINITGLMTHEPVGKRNPGVLYGLGNVVENAVDFAQTRVTITASWNEADIRLIVVDDGPGFTSDVLGRIGEPFISTRARSRDPDASGLGLGVFIAKTLLERSGARISFGNRQDRQSGACITVIWPRSAMDYENIE